MQMRPFGVVRKVLILLSVVLFALCLSQPAVDFERVCRAPFGAVTTAGLWHTPLGEIETLGGLYLFLIGPLGMLFAQFGATGWAANLLYFVALLFCLDTRAESGQKRLALVTLGLGIASLPITNLFPVMADEGGVCYLSAISPRLGYWLWIGAFASFASAVCWPNKKGSNESSAD